MKLCLFYALLLIDKSYVDIGDTSLTINISSVKLSCIRFSQTVFGFPDNAPTPLSPKSLHLPRFIYRIYFHRCFLLFIIIDFNDVCLPYTLGFKLGQLLFHFQCINQYAVQRRANGKAFTLNILHDFTCQRIPHA